MDDHGGLGDDVRRAYFGDDKPNGHAGEPHHDKPLLILPHEFAPPERPSLVDGFLGHEMDALVYGNYEAGKTFFCVDLAGCIAAGQPWRGRPVEQGIAAYLAGERQRSVQGRCLAWLLRNGHGSPDPAKPFPFAALRCGINLFNGSDDLDKLAAELMELRERLGLPVQIIVPDTVHSLSPGSDESNQAFGLLVSNTRRLRDKIAAGQQKPPAIVHTHHSGKNEEAGPRGGTGLPAAMGLMLRISAETKYRTIRCEKGSDFDKDGLQLEPFLIESVTLGHDRTSKPIQFGVAVAVAPDEADKHASEQRREAKRLHDQGMSQSEIARRLGINQSTVSRWCKS